MVVHNHTLGPGLAKHFNYRHMLRYLAEQGSWWGAKHRKGITDECYNVLTGTPLMTEAISDIPVSCSIWGNMTCILSCSIRYVNCCSLGNDCRYFPHSDTFPACRYTVLLCLGAVLFAELPNLMLVKFYYIVSIPGELFT